MITDKYKLQFDHYNKQRIKNMNIEANILRLEIKLNNAKIEAIDCEIAYNEAILSTIGGGQKYDKIYEIIRSLRVKISDLVEEQLKLTI